MHSHIANLFKEKFQPREPMLVCSPGRVNLIGEHTDYNQGFVMPAAIGKAIYFAILPNGLDTCRVYAADIKKYGEFSASNPEKSHVGWLDYLIGVTAQFVKKGLSAGGFDCVFGGDIPIGSGLSSSAALEAGLAYALNQLFGHQLPTLELVKMAQQTEHEFAGVQCGIMDMFASMFGKKGYAIQLDCRSLEFAYFPINLTGYKIVLFNTGVKHALASSAYNTRRHECQEGVLTMQKFASGIESLRDVTLEMLQQHQNAFDPVVYTRCKFVIEENNRVHEAATALRDHDLPTFGQALYASHQGLSQAYEVSCRELDWLVAYTQNHKQVLGARMMGGGFGGCTINLVAEEGLDAFCEKISIAYQKAMGLHLQVYLTETENGTHQLL
jgi:galactokinase